MKYILSLCVFCGTLVTTSAEELCVREIRDTWNATKTEGNITIYAPEIKKISHEKTIFWEYTRFEPNKIPHTDEIIDRMTVILFGEEKKGTRRLWVKWQEKWVFLYGNAARMQETLRKPFRVWEKELSGYSLIELLFFETDEFEQTYWPLELWYEFLEKDDIYYNSQDEIIYELTAEKWEHIKIILYPFHPKNVSIGWEICSENTTSNATKFLLADPIMDIDNLQIQFLERSERHITNDMKIERKYYSYKYFGEIDGKKGSINALFPYYTVTFTPKEKLTNQQMQISHGSFTHKKWNDFVIDMMHSEEKYGK